MISTESTTLKQQSPIHSDLSALMLNASIFGKTRSGKSVVMTDVTQQSPTNASA